jgi:hypothetical protein
MTAMRSWFSKFVPLARFGRAGSVAVVGVGMLSAGCGLTVQRDLSSVKPGVVVYDDMCDLQSYFDALHDSTIQPPQEVFAQDLSSGADGRATGGKARYRFSTDFQLHHVRKLLASNWSGLPEDVAKAPAVDLEVRWSEKAGVKRVVSTEDATLGAGDKSWNLPYHVCLSDLLFGESLYNTRRSVLNLPAPPRSPYSKLKPGEPDPRTAAAAATAATALPPRPSSAPLPPPPSLTGGVMQPPAPAETTPPAAATAEPAPVATTEPATTPPAVAPPPSPPPPAAAPVPAAPVKAPEPAPAPAPTTPKPASGTTPAAG